MRDLLVLAGGLLVALVCCGFALRWTARGLGVRLPRRVVVYGVILSMGVLAPWFVRPQLLTSTDFLSKGTIPGAPALEDPGRYELLNDQALQFLPWEMELRRLWAAGEWGFWSDSLEGGSSLWGNPQASVLSPTAWIARAFPIQHFFLVKVAVQWLVCFLGTALLVRRLGGSWTSGSLAGLAAALGGGMIPWATFTHAGAAAWVPWTTAGLVTLARSPNRLAVVCTGVLISFLLLSGHPEVAFAGGVLGVLVAFSVRSKKRLWSVQLGAVLVSAGIGWLLAAPAVFPFLAALGGSQRAAELGVHSQALEGVAMSLAPSSWFLTGSARLAEVVLHPYVFGKPFLTDFSGTLNWLEAGAGYAGIFSLAGAALAAGLWLPRARALLAFWLVALLLASGFVPFLWVARSLPGFSAMAFPRALLVGSIALSVVAGLGFDAVRRAAPSLLGWVGVVLVGGASVWAGGTEHIALSALVWILVLIALYFGEPSGGPSRDSRNESSGGFLVSKSFSSAQVRWRLSLVGVILLAQLPWAWLMLPKSDPAGFYPPSGVFDALAGAAEQGLSDMPKRVLGAGYLGYPSLLSVYGFHQTRSHNPMAPVGWLRVNRAAFGFAPDATHYFSEVERLNGTWLDVLGIGAVLSTEGASRPFVDSQAEDLELTTRLGPFAIFHNPNALERWFAAHSWEVVNEASLEERLAQLEDARHVLLSNAVPAAFLGSGRDASFGKLAEVPSLTALGVRPGAVDLEVAWQKSSSAGGFLLATTLAGPKGWNIQARDAAGLRIPVRKATVHGAFLGAWVPGEVQELHLRYVPPLLVWGLAAWLLGIASVLVVLKAPLAGRTTRTNPNHRWIG